MKDLFRIVSIFICIVLFSIFSSSLHIAHASVNSWQKGASIYPTYAGAFASQDFSNSLSNLAATGANYVTLIIPYFQSNEYTIDIHPEYGRNTPTDADLIHAIDLIHSHNMHVVLKPHIDMPSNNWRAGINPPDRDGWFNNYQTVLNHYGEIGRAHGVEGMVIGTELAGMADDRINPTNSSHWRNVIRNLRPIFPGYLTYSMNWNWEEISFWDALDYIGSNSYYPLRVTGTPTVESLRAAWDQIRITKLEPLHNTYNKPILFPEGGYKSVQGAYLRPFAWDLDGPYDGEEQSRDYEALFSYWNNYPWIHGISIWNWDTNPNYGWPGNKDYTPQHKPAQNTITQWFTGNIPPPSPTPIPPQPSPTSPIIQTPTPSGLRRVSGQVLDVGHQTSENECPSGGYPGKNDVWVTLWGIHYQHRIQTITGGIGQLGAFYFDNVPEGIYNVCAEAPAGYHNYCNTPRVDNHSFFNTSCAKIDTRIQSQFIRLDIAN